MADTKIEWCDKVWNPVTGCTKVSQGCKNCYAEREWIRKKANPNAKKYFGRDFTQVACHPETLGDPLHWQKPARIFVNSMSDLFHPDVPDAFLAAVFSVMASASMNGHTFMVLTKRPQRMLDVVKRLRWQFGFGLPSWAPRCILTSLASLNDADWVTIGSDGKSKPNTAMPKNWPNGVPPNIWLGVSVEDQKAADERIPLLLQTPAAVRFISAEPLLGPIDLTKEYLALRCGGRYPFPSLEDEHRTKIVDLLNWVICGGESGPNARPLHPDWARSLRDQCQAAGVPFFFKQFGEWQVASFENGHYDQDMARNNAVWVAQDGSEHKPSSHGLENPIAMFRAGKKAAGCLLDGREWKQFPEAPHA